MANRRLIATYSQWRDERLPPGSPRDEIDELHGEIATIDTWVAGMVVPFVEHGTRNPLKVDIQAGIERARTQVTELSKSAGEQDRALLERYDHYLDVLASVFSEFLAETSRST